MYYTLLEVRQSIYSKDDIVRIIIFFCFIINQCIELSKCPYLHLNLRTFDNSHTYLYDISIYYSKFSIVS